MKDYSLTKEQLKAVTEVEKAMKKASKVGVGFWDNYGMLTAYNALLIYKPVPEDGRGYIELDYMCVRHLDIDNFHAGNADDTLHIRFK